MLTGKSKSLDSCDLLSTQTKLSSKQLEKLHEESSSAAAGKKSTCSSTYPSTSSEEFKRCTVISKNSTSTVDDIIRADVELPTTTTSSSSTARLKEPSSESESQSSQQKPANTSEALPKRRIDVITSFTDSPLFTRKHRFGNRNNGDTSSPTMSRRNENGFSLVKQLTEGRWRRKDPKQNTTTEAESKQTTSQNANELQQRSENRNSDSTVEATPVESRASVSLHTQVINLAIIELLL